MTKTVDELMRLADDSSAAFFGATRTGNIEHAESKRAALRSALEELCRDAERLAGLHKTCDYDGYGWWLNESCLKTGDAPPTLDEFRFAIDAAMQQAPEQEG